MPVELFVGVPGTQQPQMHDPDNPGLPKIQLHPRAILSSPLSLFRMKARRAAGIGSSHKRTEGRISTAAFIGSRTEANLRQAFATATLADRRYIASAEQADAEGSHPCCCIVSSDCQIHGQSGRSASE
jgi:hypothetical protein